MKVPPRERVSSSVHLAQQVQRNSLKRKPSKSVPASPYLSSLLSTNLGRQANHIFIPQICGAKPRKERVLNFIVSL